jgi:hypothetical protein
MIRGLGITGSADALVNRVVRDTRNRDQSYYRRYAEAVCEVIDHEQAVAASTGVRVHDPGARDEWVTCPDGEPPHRSADNHWSHMGSDIYVDPSHR